MADTANLDHYFFNIQAGLLELNLQLAEGESKAKRTVDFETTYKNAAGIEITIKRSPDGKFANKNSSASATGATAKTETLDPQVARENGKAVREILTGKVGDDLKKDLAADFEHRPIIKEAIEKVDFAEVTKGDADALTNINNFMQRKFKEAVDASSMLGRELAASAVAVAGYTARCLAFGLALRGTLLVPASVGLIKQGETPKEILKRAAELSPELIKEVFSLKNIGRLARRGAIIEGIFRAIELATKAANKPPPFLVEPETDKAIREAMRAIGNNTLQNSLIAGAVQSPGVAEGIKSTNIEDVIEGSQDAFSNAVAFMRDKVEEAATVVSENKKEIAIGAAVVALAVASAGATAVLNATVIRAGLTTVLSLLKGSNFPDALMLGLKSATPEKIKALISQKIYALAISVKLGTTAHQAINEQVESVKLARSGGVGAKSFDKKEEGVKKLVAEEGLDYEKVLQRIADRKEELPNPKKAEQIQKEILSIQSKIEDGARKAKAVVIGKSSFTASDTTELLAIAKKETELRNTLIEKRGALATAEGRGFSLQKRFNELMEIAKTEGKQSSSYKWRASVIKAEIEYGEKLDNLDSAEDYNKLMDAMKKSVPAPGRYTPISSSDSTKFYSFFLGNMSLPKTPLEKQEAIVKQAQEAGMVLQNYLNTPIIAQVGLEGGMTCAIPGGNNKYSQITRDIAKGNSLLEPLVQTETFNNKKIDGFINIGDAVVDAGGQKLQGYNASASSDEHIREMMWHESGHILEVKLGKVEESVAFREERSNEVPADKKEIPPKGISLGSQDFALGDFYSPYIGLRMKGQGKYADRDTATEVLSSGMELLSSPTLVKRGVKVDRETILYALAAMNEKVKD